MALPSIVFLDGVRGFGCIEDYSSDTFTRWANCGRQAPGSGRQRVRFRFRAGWCLAGRIWDIIILVHQAILRIPLTQALRPIGRPCSNISRSTASASSGGWGSIGWRGS